VLNVQKDVYSLPIDVITRYFNKLPNGDFEVLPRSNNDEDALDFENVLDELYVNANDRKYHLQSKVDNNWMSRCVKNRSVVPRNFLSFSEAFKGARTVPYYVIGGNRILFYPRHHERVPLTDFTRDVTSQLPSGGRKTRKVK
jgi:hypothetical protein